MKFHFAIFLLHGTYCSYPSRRKTCLIYVHYPYLKFLKSSRKYCTIIQAWKKEKYFFSPLPGIGQDIRVKIELVVIKEQGPWNIMLLKWEHGLGIMQRSTEGHLPPKVVFHQRLSSTECHLPQKVPKIVFHRRSSSTNQNTLVNLKFVRTVIIPNLSLLPWSEVA